MSIVQTWQTESTSSDATVALAEQVGHHLRGGEVIEIISDLGGGKTTFVKGLAKGMGSKDVVRSPSFTLSNQYKAVKLTLHHFDFYRLTEPGILKQELEELLTDKDSLIVIEWPQIIESFLPPTRLIITITVSGDTTRNFEFTYPQELAYLINA